MNRKVHRILFVGVREGRRRARIMSERDKDEDELHLSLGLVVT
jgi:hypothetical protein